MLSQRFVLPAALTLSLVLTSAVVADAAMTADQSVAARQAAMTADQASMKVAVKASGDAAAAALQPVLDHMNQYPALFPAGSATPDSKALPTVWSQQDRFDGMFAKAAAVLTDAIASAKAGDTAKYQTDLKSINFFCTSCHTTFKAVDRRP